MGWSFGDGSGRIRPGWRPSIAVVRALGALGAVSVIGLGIATTMAAGIAVASVSATSARSCHPGSGPRLAGHHLNAAKLEKYGHDLTCANLRGADLSGLSLVQIDFTGANMRSANLEDANLTQATLSDANLSGADLSGATMIQVTARRTRFTDANLRFAKMGQTQAPRAQFHGADLSHADLSQANLIGADLSGTKLTGTSFIQAELGGATFTGAKGVRPWSTYLLAAAAAVFVLLLLGTLMRIVRTLRLRALGIGIPGAGTLQMPGQGMGGMQFGPSGQGPQGFQMPGTQGPPVGGATGTPLGGFPAAPMGGMPGPSMGGFGGPPAPGFPGPGMAGVIGNMGGRRYRRYQRPIPVMLISGLIGAIVVAAGFHIFAGGVLNQVVSSFGPPLSQVCTGALCKVGAAASTTGIAVGAVIAIVGLVIRRI